MHSEKTKTFKSSCWEGRDTVHGAAVDKKCIEIGKLNNGPATIKCWCDEDNCNAAVGFVAGERNSVVYILAMSVLSIVVAVRVI